MLLDESPPPESNPNQLQHDFPMAYGPLIRTKLPSHSPVDDSGTYEAARFALILH
jgi:hypothetical protein